MGGTYQCFRLYISTLLMLFVTGGLLPTIANDGCPVVRLSGEYVHKSRQMTTYSVTSQTVGDRPVYESDTTNDFLYYLESLNEWLVGSTPGGNRAHLAARDSAILPESITQGTFEVSTGSQFVSAPNLRVSCSVPGYIGCYRDDFALNEEWQWTRSSITIEACRQSCREESFRYTALYGDQCWCATHIRAGFRRESQPNCDWLCDGNPLQFCGRIRTFTTHGYSEVYTTITDCGPVPVTPGVTSVRPSHGANISVGHTAEVHCWNGFTVTVECLQNGSFSPPAPFCPEPTTAITETSVASARASSPVIRTDMDGQSGDRSRSIVPIVAGVVGGLVFIVTAAAAAFFIMRKRNAGLAQKTPTSPQRGTNLDNSTYHEPVMSDVVLTDTGAQYLPNPGGQNNPTGAATDGEPQYSTIPEFYSIDEMERKGAKTPQNNNLDQLYSRPVKKRKNNSEEGMVDNVLYERSDDVTDGEGPTGSNNQDRYVDNDLYG